MFLDILVFYINKPLQPFNFSLYLCVIFKYVFGDIDLENSLPFETQRKWK